MNGIQILSIFVSCVVLDGPIFFTNFAIIKLSFYELPKN